MLCHQESHVSVQLQGFITGRVALRAGKTNSHCQKWEEKMQRDLRDPNAVVPIPLDYIIMKEGFCSMPTSIDENTTVHNGEGETACWWAMEISLQIGVLWIRTSESLLTARAYNLLYALAQHDLVHRKEHEPKLKKNEGYISIIACARPHHCLSHNKRADTVRSYLLLLLLFKLNTIPNLLIRGKPYHLRRYGE